MLTKSLGVIVIGDEILRGDFVDTNFSYVAKKAPSYGLVLKKVSVIQDIVESISTEIQQFSNDFDVVVTSGGIGPTHDDRTFEAVSKAFGAHLQIDPRLLNSLTALYDCAITDFVAGDRRLNLTRVPATANLIFGSDPDNGLQSPYPVVCVRNVFILPGVPEFFRLGFGIIKDHICDPSAQFFGKTLYCTCDEVSIAARIDYVAEKYKETVLIGSYPIANNSYYKVRISVESRVQSELDTAIQELAIALSEDLISFDPDPVSHAAERVYNMAKEDSPFGRKVAASIQIIEDSIQQFGRERVSLSFNGGKDCTALLHMLFAVLNQNSSAAQLDAAPGSSRLCHPRLLYIRSQTPFPEVESFVQSVLRFYRFPPAAVKRHSFTVNDNETPDGEGDSITAGLRDSSSTYLYVYEGSIKANLFKFALDAPDMEAIFMGTRSSDPRGDTMTVMMPTDPAWPQFMRIHPILNWTYCEIWRFIRDLSLPYCCLYDRGYTSLGSMEDTHPNPDLRVIASSGLASYRPAYSLDKPHTERTGRVSLPWNP